MLVLSFGNGVIPKHKRECETAVKEGRVYADCLKKERDKFAEGMMK